MKNDLMVRTISALVMLAVAIGALMMGGKVFDGFVIIVALVCFGEFLRLVIWGTNAIHWRIIGLVLGAIYIGTAANALVRMNGVDVFSLLCVVIATDVGAYFSGRMLGGAKIAPAISPSKTWAGLFGGMIFAGIVFAGISFEVTGKFMPAKFALAFVFGALFAVVAQMGDFFESWMKRKADVKDSSALIPGHGGVFDRIDGLIPVAIVMFILGKLA